MKFTPLSMALCKVFIASSSETLPQNPPIAHAPKLISDTSQPVRPSARYLMSLSLAKSIGKAKVYPSVSPLNGDLIFHWKLTAVSLPIHRLFLKSWLHPGIQTGKELRSLHHATEKCSHIYIRDLSNRALAEQRDCASYS